MCSPSHMFFFVNHTKNIKKNSSLFSGKTVHMMGVLMKVIMVRGLNYNYGDMIC